MNPRERNALLAALTASGLRHIARSHECVSPAPNVEKEAHELLARFLATLHYGSSSELMRRSFPFEHPMLGQSRPQRLEE